MTRAVAVFIILAAGTVCGARGSTPCTLETLQVEGAPVSVDYCVSGVPRSNGSEVMVSVAATYSAPGGTLRRTTLFRFLAGEGVSRVLESVDLTKVGLTGTLHLTLAYSRGLVRVEGALLTPGAITIK